MRLKKEVLVIVAALWFVGVGVVTGRVNGLNLLGFYPLLLRMIGEELR